MSESLGIYSKLLITVTTFEVRINMTCSVVRVYETWVFVSFSTKSLKVEDKDEELSGVFEIELLALKPIAIAMKMFRKLEPEPTKILAQETDI